MNPDYIWWPGGPSRDLWLTPEQRPGAFAPWAFTAMQEWKYRP